jgi:hypothetical protein
MSQDVQPTGGLRLEGPEEDVRAILAAHRDWWAGNHGLEVARCRRNFAPGTLMFNLNGHTYYGLDEMTKVWEYYHDNSEVGLISLWDIRVYVDGDLAYLTSEGIFPKRAITQTGSWTGGSNIPVADEPTDIPFRETSVFRRDDGVGHQVWKIWHFHCSASAPADAPRPPFDDTRTSRGGDLGGARMMTAQRPLD